VVPEVAAVHHGKVVRPCGGCTVCCDVLPVEALNKGLHERCPHAVDGVGCSIYGEYFEICKTYRCVWTLGHGSEEDRPDLSGVLVDCRQVRGGERGIYALQVDHEKNIQGTLQRIADDVGAPVQLLDEEMEPRQTSTSPTTKR